MKLNDMLAGLLLAGPLLAGTPAHAVTLISSTFDTGVESWRAGFFTGAVGSGTSTPVYDPINQWLRTSELLTSALDGLIAPAAYLGDFSAAFGGTISFDLANASSGPANNRGPLFIRTGTGGSTSYYAKPLGIPSQNPGAPTQYVITLTGANFATAIDGTGAVTDAQLLAALADIDRLSVLTDWHTGGDTVTFDNFFLCTADGCGAPVPEPASWMLMIMGLGAAGGALRRRNVAAKVTYARSYP